MRKNIIYEHKTIQYPTHSIRIILGESAGGLHYVCQSENRPNYQDTINIIKISESCMKKYYLDKLLEHNIKSGEEFAKMYDVQTGLENKIGENNEM